MLALDRAVARNAVAGVPLPFPWEGLAIAPPRLGQLCMVYGPAGSCKSMFALNVVLAWKRPTLYISPDTDQHDMAQRVLSHQHGLPSESVEHMLEVGALDLAGDLSGLGSWLRFSFDPSPTVDDVDLELLAFEEQFGSPPEVLIVDTLSDVHANDEDEFGGYRRTMGQLHHIARATNALVIALHHTTGEFDGDVAPAPRRGINGKLSKVPELILSVARNNTFFGVAVVKNRSGWQDPLAREPVWLTVDAPRATITDRIESTYTSNWSE